MPKPKVTMHYLPDWGWVVRRDGAHISIRDMTDPEFELWIKKSRFDAVYLAGVRCYRAKYLEGKASFAALIEQQTAHIPRLTDDSRVSDVHTYLEWLAASPYRYDIDKDPEQFAGVFNTAIAGILQKNHEIMWAIDDSLWMYYGRLLFRQLQGVS